MREKVLVVEDEKNIRSFVSANLSVCDFQVIEAESGEEALEKCEEEEPNVAVLDIMLPGINGYTVCKKLRKKFPNIAIIILSAKGQDVDKIIGLDIGADDYIVKPFNPMELISRIKAILRRIKRIENTKKVPSVIKCADLKIDNNEQKFYVNNEEINFTNREFKLMYVFMVSPGKAFTRNELLDKGWGKDFFGDYKTVDVHIRRLREKIEENPSEPYYIETIRGYGYRLKK